MIYIDYKSILLIKNDPNSFTFSHNHPHPQCDVNSQAMPLQKLKIPATVATKPTWAFNISSQALCTYTIIFINMTINCWHFIHNTFHS